MLYIFQSGTEFVKLKIDRIEKRFEIATSQTNYRFFPQPYWKLFGDTKGDLQEAKIEMAKCEILNDHGFEIYLVKEFLKKGYVFFKKNNEVINQKEYYQKNNIKIESVNLKGG